MCRCTSQYWLCHRTLFSATTKTKGKKQFGNMRLKVYQASYSESAAHNMDLDCLCEKLAMK